MCVQVRKNGTLTKVSWEEALVEAAHKLNEAGGSIAALVGGMADAESLVALKDLLNKCV